MSSACLRPVWTLSLSNDDSLCHLLFCTRHAGRALFSDMGSHGLAEGSPLKHPLFPIIYPQSDPYERAERAAGRCTRTTEGIQRLAGNIFSSMGEMMSWTNVVNPDKEKEKA